MKKTQRTLLGMMLGSIGISLLLVLLYETDIFLSGTSTDNKSAEFLTVTFMELLTICLIPLSLRLFKFKHIHRQLATGKASKLLVWGTLRMVLLCLPMMVNTLLYYLFMNVAFGYMALIGLISLTFIYPNMQRCISETSQKQ